MDRRLLITSLTIVALLALMTMFTSETEGESIKRYTINEHEVVFDSNFFTVFYHNTEGEKCILNDMANLSVITSTDPLKLYAVTKYGYCIPKMNGNIYSGSAIVLDDHIDEVVFSVELFQYEIELSTKGTDEYKELIINYSVTAELLGTILIPDLNHNVTKYGYEPNCWNTKEDGTGTNIMPGLITITEDFLDSTYEYFVNNKLTLYPIFIKKEYQILCNLNDGVRGNIVMCSSIKIDESINLSDYIYERDGSVFKCWKLGDLVFDRSDIFTLKKEIVKNTETIVLCVEWSACISPNLNHCTSTSTCDVVDYGTPWTTIIKSDEHYHLPSEIEITGANYTLNSNITATISTQCVNSPIIFSISAIPIEHTITFDSRGGSDVESLTFTEIEEKTLPIPTKAGHTFNGWFDGENKIENTTGIVDDITVIADWTYVPPTYLVRFYDRQDGNLIQEVTTEGTVTAPETPSRSGYRFVQWKSTDGAFTGTVTKDTDYYAEWAYVPPTYLVRFYDIQGGNLVHETITECSVTAPEAPTRSGYRFVQWKSTDGVFTGTVNRNTDYYAEWSMIYVPSPTKPDPVVTFYLEEGGEMYVQYRQSEFKESPVPAKNGYTFDHWYHLVDLERVEFTGEFDEDIDVYASWTAKMNRFHLSEGEDTWFEGYVCSNDPVKEGHVFDGWYIIDGDEKKQFTGGLDLDVYASWKEETISPPSSDRDMGLLLPVIVMSLILVMILGFVIHQKRVR